MVHLLHRLYGVDAPAWLVWFWTRRHCTVDSAKWMTVMTSEWRHTHCSAQALYLGHVTRPMAPSVFNSRSVTSVCLLAPYN